MYNKHNMEDTIFIQIAAYRDPELVPTIKDCIANAAKPENLIFSIAWQHSDTDEWDNLDEFKNDTRFRIIDIDYRKSKGCCWARNALQQNYAGEKYTLQLDSHHRFVKDWDKQLIEMYNQLRLKGVNKPLLTGYLPSYTIDNEPAGRVMSPYKMNFDRFIPEGAVFFLPAAIENWQTLTEPIPARFYSAHFAFTTGDFAREVQHDPQYYFHGEEISIGVRAFTHGYDLFHPHRLIAWHEYTRAARTKHWTDNTNWHIQNTESHLRNRKLFEMDGLKRDYSFGIYDFGTVRTLEDYEKYAGISFKKRAVQAYTLKHNPAPNPVLNDDDYEQSFCKQFKHCLDLHKSIFRVPDIEFTAVIFEDESGQVYRQDASVEEINSLMNTPDDYIKMWRTFEAERMPKQYIIWPFIKSIGWGQKIVKAI